MRLVNNTPASSFEQTVGPLLDLPGFVRYIAAQNFIAQDDGFNGYAGMNNFYFYRLENSTRHAFIAWDEDNAFLSPQFLINTRLGDNVLTRKTLELPAFQAQYYNSLLEAATSASDWMQQEMQRQFAMIADAMQSDTKKPYSNATTPPRVMRCWRFRRSASASCAARSRSRPGRRGRPAASDRLGGLFDALA